MTTLIEQSVGIFTTDTRLMVRSWDAWLANVTGMLAHIVRDVNLVELFPELETQGLQDLFQQALAGQVVKLSPPTHPYLIPCMLQAPSKYFEYMQQSVTISPLRDRDRIVGMIVTIEDVTRQFERERDLAELNTRLKSPDESTRLQAVKLLATQEEGLTEVTRLFDVLGDKSWQVRQVAVDSLIQRGGSQAIESLVRRIQLEHHDLSILNSALKALSQIEGDIVTPLAQLLHVPDEDLRGYAALALGEQYDRRAIPALIEALNDSNTNVRYNAVEALGKLGAVEAVNVLADLVESGDFFLAFPALESLKKIGDPSVSSRMLRLLTDEILCEPAIEALGYLGDVSVVSALLELLNTRDDLVLPIVHAIATLFERYEELFNEGFRIAECVRQAVSEQGVLHLLSALEKTARCELRYFALVLGCLEGEAVEYALSRLLGAVEPAVQTEVLQALVRFGPRVVNILIGQLNSQNAEVCQAMICALGRIRDRQSIPALLPFLSSDNETLIVVAIEALTKIGDLQIFEPLLELLGHSSVTVRQAAIGSLNALNPPFLPDRLVSLLRHSNPLKRESAIRIMGYIGYRAGFEQLLTCCHDIEEHVCQAAIEVLPCFESSQVITYLHEALTQGSPKLRAAAARALALVEHETVSIYLQAALKDSDAWVRYFAARSLGQQGTLDAVEALSLLAMTDPAIHVRISAVEALGQLGNSQVIPLLTLISHLPDVDLAHAALSALGHIRHPDALLPLLSTVHSSSREYRLKALQALRHHPNPEVVADLQRIATVDEDGVVVEAVLGILADMATPEAIAALLGLMVHPKRRFFCVELLSHLNESHIHLVAGGLKHKHVGVRLATVDVLARMKHPVATQFLLAALKDDEASLRLSIVTCLGSLESQGIKQKLLEVVRCDPNIAVRRAAEKFLNMRETQSIPSR